MKKYTVDVVKSSKYYDNDFVIRLKKPAGFDFKAGQFVMAHVGREKRAFSIASPPSWKFLELLIKKHDNGKVSPVLYGLDRGDKATISGPYGTFNVKETSSKEIIFIAGGAGLAPFRSMIYDVLQNKPKKKVTLIFSFKKDFFFRGEFTRLDKKYRNFKLIPCCSGRKKNWKGLRGRATVHLKKLVKNSNWKDVYICGPSGMKEDVIEILIKDLKFKKEQIFVESWA